MSRRRFLFFLFVFAHGAGFAALPPPAEPPDAAGVIRVWGTAELKPVLERWEEGFKKTHPAARFESRMTGSDVGLPGLYTRRADIALLGREATAAEIKAFEWIFRYRSAAIEVATGSLGAPGRSPALVVYVHRDNSLAQLTLAQLDAAFGCEHLRGAPENIRTWGQLGLTGEWRDQPIHLYAPDTEEGTGRFFRSVVLNDSRMLDWEHLREFVDTKGRVATHDAGRKIIDALAADPLGLAVAGAGLTDTRVKPLALAAAATGPFVAPTRDSLVARNYPLTRAVFAYVNRAPGGPLDPKVREFLAYVLSAEGQREIERAGDYLPLTTAAAGSTRASLN
jgi:phosphate transport system substrate-binding protein